MRKTAQLLGAQLFPIVLASIAGRVHGARCDDDEGTS
jgi:hypothetical protein